MNCLQVLQNRHFPVVYRYSYVFVLDDIVNCPPSSIVCIKYVNGKIRNNYYLLILFIVRKGVNIRRIFFRVLILELIES